MEGRYWEDVDVGDTFTTQSRTVTEADLVNFEGLSGIFEPLFIDREYVTKHSIFGKPMIPGPLTLIMSFGLEALMGLARGTGMALLGLDEVRLPRPVFINDTIHVDMEIVEKHETSKPDRGIMTIKYTTKNQNGDSVLNFRLTRMVRRRRIKVLPELT